MPSDSASFPAPKRRRNERLSALRKRVLSEWRGFDEYKNLDSRVHPASRFVESILKQSGLQTGIHEQELKAAWREIAGDFVARHTEPRSIKNDILTLRVTQPAMRFELEQIKPILLAQIRKNPSTGTIRSIQFTLG
ncbi:MAG: DUF721 domain-containing protein [Luteolibacter sp.]